MQSGVCFFRIGLLIREGSWPIAQEIESCCWSQSHHRDAEARRTTTQLQDLNHRGHRGNTKGTEEKRRTRRKANSAQEAEDAAGATAVHIVHQFLWPI